MSRLIKGYALGTTDPRLVRVIENWKLIKQGIPPTEINKMLEKDRKRYLAIINAEEAVNKL